MSGAADVILGIDLGTTNSVVAVADGKEARVLTDAEGVAAIPSVVSFPPGGVVMVGEVARERRLLDAPSTVYGIKRLLGRPFESDEVAKALRRFPFELARDAQGGVRVQVRDKTYALPEVSAYVLRECRRRARESLGARCERAVITVPASFNELQRSATIAAGRIAGIDVVRILNEPTAAAVAYGYGQARRGRVAVYDLGGGTFDVTILELDGDVLEVLSTAGDTFLGGDDVDLVIAEMMSDAFLRQHRWDPREHPQAFERLRAASEWAKCQLSAHERVEVRVAELAHGEGGKALDLDFKLTRMLLEERIDGLIDRSLGVCAEAMKLAGLKPEDLTSVILVGGSTRIPMVRVRVAAYFGKEPELKVDPDLVVAIGAAMQAFSLSGQSRDRVVGIAQPTEEQIADTIAEKERARNERPDQPAFAPIPMVPRAPPMPGKAQKFVPKAPPMPEAPKAPPAEPVKAARVVAVARKDAGLDSLEDPFAKKKENEKPEPRRDPTLVGIGKIALTKKAARKTKQSLPPPAETMEVRAKSVPPPAPLPKAPLPKAPPAPPPPLPLPTLPEADLGAVSGPEPESVPPPKAASLPPPPPPSVRPPPPPPPRPPPLRPAPPPPASVRPPPPSIPPPSVRPLPPAMAVAETGASSGPSLDSLDFGGFAEETDLEGSRPIDLGDLPVPEAAMPELPALDEAPVAQKAPPKPKPIGGRTLTMAAFVVPNVPMPQTAMPILMDVTPHSLAVETAGGYCECIIRRNAAIPVEQRSVFTTAKDDQESVRVRVCQGEARQFAENQALGEIELGPLPKARRGVVKVEVTFMLDANGTLDVRAKDTETGREQSIRISLKGGIDDAEIDRMRANQEAGA